MRPTIVRVPAERENGLCFPVQTRRALPSTRAEGSPEKPLINQARPAEGTLSPYASASPGTDSYLRPQIKHVATSQRKHASQWDFSRVQLNKSLDTSGASLEGEHISTVKHPQWKSHSQKVI